MSETSYLLVVLSMGVVTYVPRWFPLFFLAQRRLPMWLIEWLDLIPAAILSALIFPDLFTANDPRQLELFQIKSLVAVPTLLFSLKTKSLGGTVVVGMSLYWVAGKLMG
ncbi:AzlD domain-containing protein [Desulfoferrobacter suflitae]|uniref:AzlD domain-containing protein n=1 Tax=Desulfoferrobacter suflitae TaxID=2865782 RepID=UPI002164EE46|nr:AzlD domain-containing protein [Desulfoferrobacter suflitae]MCK8602028.1 AzlD domain-containing protein [Desulfoferrobacter suflitae]